MLGIPLAVLPPSAARDGGGPDDPGPADGDRPRPADAVAGILAGLPDELTVRTSDGRELVALVAVLAPPTVTDTRELRRIAWPAGWTRPPGRLAVLAPSVARALGRPGPALALVRTPEDVEGPLEVAGRSLDVRWADPNAAYAGQPLPGFDRPRLPLEARPDRPDPDDPLAWWRWVLLADDMGWRPPPPTGEDERGRRMAEHRAARWRLGLARLGAAHPGVASALRDVLTLIVRPAEPAEPAEPVAADPSIPSDGPGPGGASSGSLPSAIAAWRTESPETDRILAGLLDLDRPVSRTAAEIVAWIDATPEILAWRAASGSGGAAPDPVGLVLANRAMDPRRLRLAWDGRGPTETREVTVPGRTVLHLSLARPQPLDGSRAARLADAGPAAASSRTPDAAGRPDVLLVTTPAARSLRVAWPPPVVSVRPPGIDLRPVPGLTLAAVEAGTVSDPAAVADIEATARVRRRAGRWEVFVECVRPPGTEGDVVEVLLGSTADGRILRIPERGAIEWTRTGSGTAAAAERPAGGSAADDEAPRVDRRSWRDRWYARVTLPRRWTRGETLALGLRRGIADEPDAGMATAPGPSEPWVEDPGRVRLDLSDWDGL